MIGEIILDTILNILQKPIGKDPLQKHNSLLFVLYLVDGHHQLHPQILLIRLLDELKEQGLLLLQILLVDFKAHLFPRVLVL